MRRQISCAVLLGLLMEGLASCFPLFAIPGCATSPKNPWVGFEAPYGTEPQAIGDYAAGCLAGAQRIPLQGPGFYIMRPGRRRYYGHPELIRFIEWLGNEAKSWKLGSVLVGDLAQPRGGPTLSGHNSHQNGLDVDFWFQLRPSNQPSEFSIEDRENMPALSVLKDYKSGIDPGLWGNAQYELLKIVAQSDQVERIFVDPWIKKAFCASKDRGRPWLNKLRPWWNHHDHFHVRLRCPPGSPHCNVQKAVPAGNGCDASLAWWFSEEGIKSMEERVQKKEPPKMPILPNECLPLLEG